PTVPTRPQSYSPSWYAALKELARANAALYYIDPRGLVHHLPDAMATAPASAPQFGAIGDQSLDDAIAFSRLSGGAAFVHSNDFDRDVSQIWQETGDYYLLGHAAPTADEKSHTITVNVKRRGMTVHARRTRSGPAQ